VRRRREAERRLVDQEEAASAPAELPDPLAVLGAARARPRFLDPEATRPLAEPVHRGRPKPAAAEVECPGRRPPRARGLPAGRGVAREADAAPGGRFAYTGGEANQDAFYTSASARKAYMAHVRTVLSRVNTINNKARPRSCALHVSGATRPASQSQRTRPARTCGAHAACVRSGAGPPAPPTRRPARPRGKRVARPTRAAPARRRHTVTTTRFKGGAGGLLAATALQCNSQCDWIWEPIGPAPVSNALAVGGHSVMCHAAAVEGMPLELLWPLVSNRQWGC